MIEHISDPAEIESLISSLYRPDHVLTRNRVLLDRLHLRPDGTYNFSKLVDSDGEALAILGYIPASRWDPNIPEDSVFTAIWAARKDSPGAGSTLVRTMISRWRPRPLVSVGLGATSERILALLGLQTGVLRQLCILAPKFRPTAWGGTLRVAPARTQSCLTYGDQTVDAESIGRLWHQEWSTWYPNRSAKFILTRYLEDPLVQYKVNVVSTGHESVLIVFRVINSSLGRSIKILDVLSSLRSPGPLAAVAVADFLEHWGADFADFYVASAYIPPGFLDVAQVDGLVIPNFLDPAETRNVRITFASSLAPGYLTRGDGDQDRVNS